MTLCLMLLCACHIPHASLHVCMLRIYCMYLCMCVFAGSVPGMRPAEAGEFTRRAFQAGKMGLTEVGQVEQRGVN